MSPQPNQQPGVNPRLAQYQAMNRQMPGAMGGAPPMGGMPAGGPGGAQMPAPNFRGMGAPPNQAPGQAPGQMPGPMQGQGRMPAPWMQQPSGSPQPTPPGATATSAGSPQSNLINAGPVTPQPTPGQMPGQAPGRMPAPWMRPQQNGAGMGPGQRMQSQGVQPPAQPQTMRPNVPNQDQNRQNNTY